MSKKRFLRDNVLYDMLDNFDRLTDSINENELSGLCSLDEQNSIRMMFETNKVVLERIEEVIEGIRGNVQTEEMLIPLSEAAMHIQTAMRSVYESLANRVESRDDLDDAFDDIDFEL